MNSQFFGGNDFSGRKLSAVHEFIETRISAKLLPVFQGEAGGKILRSHAQSYSKKTTVCNLHSHA